MNDTSIEAVPGGYRINAGRTPWISSASVTRSAGPRHCPRIRRRSCSR
ncbi:hypothetical protein NKH18_20825 [Streptomyces sp. M10(2022)]